MAFRIADFKKTTRKAGDARQLYPHQIRDDRYTAAIGYAIAYFERMVGRRRATFETEALLEFFGDPRLARGLVACLSRTYTWREQTLAEAFGTAQAQALRVAGLTNPAAFRAKLYGLANGRYGGVILPGERAEALNFLCADLSVTPDQFEQALLLDSDDQRMLVQVGPTPTPQELIARYNYHSLETALYRAETLHLRLKGPVWSIIRSAHNLARRYQLTYQVGGTPRTLFDTEIDLLLTGSRDALGRWTRSGRRLTRVLLRLLAAHPDSLIAGEAKVHLGSQTTMLRLDARALRVLGVGAQEASPESTPWEEDLGEAFRRAWWRALVRGQTAGWRLRRDPEPLIGPGVVVVPDFALQRGHQQVLLCLTTSRATSEMLARDLAKLGEHAPVLAVVPATATATKKAATPAPLVAYTEQPADAIPALVTMLEEQHPRTRASAALTPWQRLERLLQEEGFVGEATVAAILGCAQEEVAQVVQRWGGPQFHVLPGLGVCLPELLGDIRDLLEQGESARHAA
jgi:hypothetical protein